MKFVFSLLLITSNVLLFAQKTIPPRAKSFKNTGDPAKTKTIPAGAKLYKNTGDPAKTIREAAYYSIQPVLENGLYHNKEFYINGVLKNESFSKTKDGHDYEGKWTEYNKDGSLYQVMLYANDDVKETLSYGANNRITRRDTKSAQPSPTGIYTSWTETYYPNGKLREKETQGEANIGVEYYDTLNNKIGGYAFLPESQTYEGTELNFDENNGYAITSKTTYRANSNIIVTESYYPGGKIKSILKSNRETLESVSEVLYDEKGNIIDEITGYDKNGNAIHKKR